jgi:hypothetical protein
MTASTTFSSHALLTLKPIERQDLRGREDFALDDTNNEKLTELYRRAFVGLQETQSDPRKMFVGLRHSRSRQNARTKHTSASVWEVQNEQNGAGGPITFNQHIRLRHFATGAFLCIRHGGEGREAVLLPHLNGRKDEEDTLFSFEYVSSNEPTVTTLKRGESGVGGGIGEDGGGDASSAGGRAIGGSSSVYCSFLALTRLLHVATREYVTIKPDGTPLFAAGRRNSFEGSVDAASEVCECFIP